MEYENETLYQSIADELEGSPLRCVTCNRRVTDDATLNVWLPLPHSSAVVFVTCERCTAVNGNYPPATKRKLLAVVQRKIAQRVRGGSNENPG